MENVEKSKDEEINLYYPNEEIIFFKKVINKMDTSYEDNENLIKGNKLLDKIIAIIVLLFYFFLILFKFLADTKKLKIEKKKTYNLIKEKQIKFGEINIENRAKEKTEIIKRIFDIEKIIIPISYALDNEYTFVLLVAMTSLLTNCNNNSYYDIYIMVPGEFTEENKQELKNFENKYYYDCSVTIINMGDKYKNEIVKRKRIKIPTYYRLDLPNLVPFVNRIIYMDCDTIVQDDLTELIQLNMKGNYILGLLDYYPDSLKTFGISKGTFICAGVLLMDLDMLRKNDMVKKFHEFLKKEKKRIEQEDQTIINVVCQGKISAIPPKYGIWDFVNNWKTLHYNERQWKELRYKKSEILYAYHHPAILHYIYIKPFNMLGSKDYKRFYDLWWKYAKISGYHKKIYQRAKNKNRKK